MAEKKGGGGQLPPQTGTKQKGAPAPGKSTKPADMAPVNKGGGKK